MFILEKKECMGETVGPRQENLDNIIGATRSYYQKRTENVAVGTTGKRHAACLEEIDKAITEITKRFGVGRRDITLYTYPRGNQSLSPIPVEAPGSIPRQLTRRPPLGENSTTQARKREGSPTEITSPTITLEELQRMSREKRIKTIKEVRRITGLSAAALARMSNIEPDILYKIENNTRSYEPTEEILAALATGITIVLERNREMNEQLLQDMPHMTAQEIVYTLLKIRNIGYKELADKVGLSPSFLEKAIGRKIRQLSRNHIKNICDVLGFDEDNQFRLRLLEQIDIEEDERRLGGKANRSGPTVVFQN